MNENLPIKEKVARHQLALPDGRQLRLGVGCAWVGRGTSYLDTLDHDLAVLTACYESGFRYFDTSRAYGNSEQTVGELMRRVPRDSVYLATKSPFYRGEDGKRSISTFRDNFYRSFERLRTDHIDLFQIHDTDHYDCCAAEVIPFLQERQAEGLISYIGMGTRSLNAHEVAIRSGAVKSSLSYLNYSLLKTSATHLIDVCVAHGAAFINASVFHYGMIRAEDPLTYRLEHNPPHMQRNREAAAAMQRLCAEHRVPVLAAALQVSLLHPGIDCTLVGIGRMENLRSTLELAQTPIGPEVWAAITALQRTVPLIDVQDDLPD